MSLGLYTVAHLLGSLSAIAQTIPTFSNSQSITSGAFQQELLRPMYRLTNCFSEGGIL